MSQARTLRETSGDWACPPEIRLVAPRPDVSSPFYRLILLSNVNISPEIFDEYTRRQYMAKAPNRNPFGIEEEPKKFAEFDVFTKLRVLVQLSQWTLINAERMRERMPETKDTEQTQWVLIVDELRITSADRSHGSVLKRLDTTNKSDSTSCSMTTAFTAEPIPDHLLPLHLSPKRTPRKAKLLHELVNGENLQRWKSQQMTQM